QLPPGTYTVCARIPADQFPRWDQPFLDTCFWEQPQNPVQLTAGQNLTGVQVVVPQAALLQIRVDDPGKLLPTPSSTAPPSAMDTQLELIVRGPNHMTHRLDFSAQDVTGRDYAIA